MRKKVIISYLLVILMTLSLFNGFTVAEVSAESGLVAHLKFDGNLTDSSGENNNAECTYGNISYADGIFGNAAVFNGKTYLEMKDNDSLDIHDLTISVWAYKSADRNFEKYMPYVYKESDEECWTQPYKLYERSGNIPILYLHDTSDETELDQYSLGGNPVDFSKWFLLTVTYDGEEARIYEDGELTKKEDIEGTVAATLGDLYIGMCDGEYYFEGLMDDLRIYNRALSANEVNGLYMSGLEESPQLLTQQKSLVAHYKMEGDSKDATEFNNDAERVAGKVTYVEGVNGKAAKLSKNTYLEVEHNESIDFDEGFTTTAWVYFTEQSDFVTLLNKPGASTTSYSEETSYGIRINEHDLEFYYTPFDDQPPTEVFHYEPVNSMAKKWIHLGITFDAKEVRFYINGKMVKKEQIPEDIQNYIAHSNGDLMIGSNGTNFFNGMIDELKLYNYALSADQIKADFNNKDSLSISSNSLNALQTMNKNASVTLAISRKYIETGRTVKLTSGVTYKTSNAKVFTVDKKGNVKAIGKGSAKLTITHGGISKTYTVKVR
jgi:hypothetical protein